MKKNQVQQDLASIRNLMERSSKFISLSGLSGILAGIYALSGSAFAYFTLNKPTLSHDDLITKIIFAAILVLLASVTTGLALSARKAKRNGQKVWGAASRSLLFQMMVPLLTGGVLILLDLNNNKFDCLAAFCLVFYGLALISASSFTFTDIKYLGLGEVVLGLISAVYPNYSLLLWALGFGLLHIVYGSIMYLKYDK